ncbi:MAG: glycerophosphodiester phosphodiesterase [Betaproteobacteria bacterium]|nr:glycerophosphodiester phosphodiesterase [Betaproteobacteria bacterium]
MAWPFPRIVAHRGGGALAPENTLGALRLGASLGFKGVEFDVMLAKDGTPVLIHDETTERTTGVKGSVPAMTFKELERLDAGNGEGIPSFEKASQLCLRLGLWANIEIKPAKGHERATGEAVARAAAALWKDAPVAPILSSFSMDALRAARAAEPRHHYGLLAGDVPANWAALLPELGCRALHCNHEKLTEEKARAVRAAGYGLLCWTVNDPAAGRRLLGWGVDCLVTDALKEIGPDFA